MLPLNEPRMFALMGELYGLAEPVTPKQDERLAEGWRPWRAWVGVLSAPPVLDSSAKAKG